MPRAAPATLRAFPLGGGACLCAFGALCGTDASAWRAEPAFFAALPEVNRVSGVLFGTRTVCTVLGGSIGWIGLTAERYGASSRVLRSETLRIHQPKSQFWNQLGLALFRDSFFPIPLGGRGDASKYLLYIQYISCLQARLQHTAVGVRPDAPGAPPQRGVQGEGLTPPTPSHEPLTL